MNTFVERRAAPQHRERVASIGALWGALALLATGAAWLQRDDTLPVPLTPVSAVAPAPTSEAPARWTGMTPDAIETFALLADY